MELHFRIRIHIVTDSDLELRFGIKSLIFIVQIRIRDSNSESRCHKV